MITPAQRKYDIELVMSMDRMARLIEPRSRKVSDTLRVAARRIEALSYTMPVDPEPQLDSHGNKIQPASTPDREVLGSQARVPNR